MCDKYNKQINENKEFEANLNELKRHPPKESGHGLPFYIIYQKYTYSITIINITIIHTHIIVFIP